MDISDEMDVGSEPIVCAMPGDWTWGEKMDEKEAMEYVTMVKGGGASNCKLQHQLLYDTPTLYRVSVCM